jgi:nucleoside-diphosphate-sugar epimerase
MFDSLTKDIEDNLIKLNRVLENCKDRDINFIFLSSWFAYGKVNDAAFLPVKESDPGGEVWGYYSICKRAAEQMIATFCAVHGKRYKILRLANIYGPGDVYSKKKNALQYLANEIKFGRDINLYYGGYFCRDYLHVDDCCRAIKLLTERGGDSIYNVSGGCAYNMIDLLEYIRAAYKSKSKFITCDPPRFHDIVQVRDMALDNSRIKRLGFAPAIGLWAGLKSL